MVGPAAYTGCRAGAAKGGGLETVDIVEGGRLPGGVLAQGIDYYRSVIGMGVFRNFTTNSRTE